MPPEELEAFHSVQQFLIEARAAGALFILLSRVLGNFVYRIDLEQEGFDWTEKKKYMCQAKNRIRCL